MSVSKCGIMRALGKSGYRGAGLLLACPRVAHSIDAKACEPRQRPRSTQGGAVAYEPPPPKAVHHTLTVYMAGEESAEGPLFLFNTQSLLDPPNIGDLTTPMAWPEPWYRPARWGQPMTVVSRRTRILEADGVVRRDCTLHLDWADDPHGPTVEDLHADLVEATADCARQKQRADFWSDTARSMAIDFGNTIIDACERRVVDRFKLDVARGAAADGDSAWREAAAVVQANDHLMVETVLRDIRDAACSIVADLSSPERIAACLVFKTPELDEDSDVWTANPALVDFDPWTARYSAADDLVTCITKRVVSQLHNVPLDN